MKLMHLLRRWIGFKHGSRQGADPNSHVPAGLSRLELQLPPDYTPVLIALEPDAAMIESTIRAQRWDDITFVVLRRDAENGIELSGSLSPADGLSARYWHNGREHVSDTAPSLDQGIALLELYARGDARWRSILKWR